MKIKTLFSDFLTWLKNYPTYSNLSLGQYHFHKSNYGKALKYFKMAARLRNPEALCSLAWMHEHAKGVQQDYSKAAKYYQQACNLDYSLAFKHLGALYEKGYGVSTDITKASHLYKKGCDLGDKNACDALNTLNNAQIAE